MPRGVTIQGNLQKREQFMAEMNAVNPSEEPDLVSQFSNIGSMLKAQFEHAKRSQAKMDEMVKLVEDGAKKRIQDLDATINNQINKKLGDSKTAIDDLTKAVNTLSRGVIQRLSRLEQELGIQQAEVVAKEESSSRLAIIEKDIESIKKDITAIHTLQTRIRELLPERTASK